MSDEIVFAGLEGGRGAGDKRRFTRRMLHRAAPFSVALALAAVSAGPAAAAGDEKTFAISTLSVADKLLDILVEDIDGDGLKDVMAVHIKGLDPGETRWVSVFWQRKEGGFGTAADQSWEADSTAAVIDMGDVAGGAEKEICFLTSGGVRYHAMEGGRFDTAARYLIESEALTVFPSKKNLPVINFVQDWNSDGSEEVAVPTFDGMSIFPAFRAAVFRR